MNPLNRVAGYVVIASVPCSVCLCDRPWPKLRAWRTASPIRWGQ